MNYIQLMKKIDGHNLAPTSLIYGEENYLIDLLIEAVSQESGEFKELNYHYFNKDNLSLKALSQAMEALPFGDSKSIVVVDDLDLTRDKIKSQEKILDLISEKMEEELSDRIIFLVQREGKPFNGKFYKKAKEYSDIGEIGKLNRRELKSFIAKRLARNNIRIRSDQADRIIDRSGYLIRQSETNLYDLVNELDKLASSQGEGLLMDDSIERVMIPYIDDNIFHFLDDLSNRRAKESLMGLNNLMRSGEDVYKIYFMVLRRIRSLCLLTEIKERRFSDKIGREKSGLSKYEYERVYRSLGKYSKEELNHAYHQLFQMDRKTKTQRSDLKAELEIFIIGITDKKKPAT